MARKSKPKTKTKVNGSLADRTFIVEVKLTLNTQDAPFNSIKEEIAAAINAHFEGHEMEGYGPGGKQIPWEVERHRVTSISQP